MYYKYHTILRTKETFVIKKAIIGTMATASRIVPSRRLPCSNRLLLR